MNSVASQSSSCGCVGLAPWLPKSSTVVTSPLPKNVCQYLLTMTLEVRGFLLLTSHLASSRRLNSVVFCLLFLLLFRNFGIPAVTSLLVGLS